jgi:hypothetical protein
MILCPLDRISGLRGYGAGTARWGKSMICPTPKVLAYGVATFSSKMGPKAGPLLVCRLQV